MLHLHILLNLQFLPIDYCIDLVGELPGCVSCGKTEEEALENILEAIELYLEPSDIKLDCGAVIREVIV